MKDRVSGQSDTALIISVDRNSIVDRYAKVGKKVHKPNRLLDSLAESHVFSFGR